MKNTTKNITTRNKETISSILSASGNTEEIRKNNYPNLLGLVKFTLQLVARSITSKSPSITFGKFVAASTQQKTYIIGYDVRFNDRFETSYK